ncbi:TetR/AcrR family transcriptional regulator [Halovulum sp. GXIMD14794]
MARPKSEEKRRQIREAAIAEVVEGGFSGASTSKLARRAGVSVGTLYIYFPDKDTLFRDVYLELKAELHARLMEAADAETGSAAKLRAMWHALHGFAVENPQAFIFAEIIGTSNMLTGEAEAETRALAQDVVAIVEAALADGTLKPAPLPAVMAMLTGPAMHLARNAAAGAASDPVVIDTTFTMLWEAIANR